MNELHELSSYAPDVPRNCDLLSDSIALANALRLSPDQAAPIVGVEMAMRMVECIECGNAMPCGPNRLFGCCGQMCLQERRARIAQAKKEVN